MDYGQIMHLFLILIVILCQTKGIMCDILKHSKECNILIENFALAASNFISCTLNNARPVQMCCSCQAAYNKVIENFDNIVKSQNSSNLKCDEKLVNQDKLEVIETTKAFIIDFWFKGQCSNCFEHINGSNEPSDTTKEFIKLNLDINQCLASFYNSSNKTYSKGVCQNCSNAYFKMSKFYSYLKETSGNGNVCMDIVDAMNVTQHLWSNVLHCGKTVLTFQIPLVIFSTIFLILPIVFYGWALKSTKTRSSAVLYRNRFGQRWRNRTGSSISH